MQGEYRPPKIPQFVPCDFTPRPNTTLSVSGVQAKTTAGALGVMTTKSEEEAQAKRENEAK